MVLMEATATSDRAYVKEPGLAWPEVSSVSAAICIVNLDDISLPVVIVTSPYFFALEFLD
jgi:hypothetical protein